MGINSLNSYKNVEEVNNTKELNDNLDIQEQSSKIKDNINCLIIGDILEDGKINLTQNEIENFINFGNILGLSNYNPISLLLKAIGENYLEEANYSPIDFLMFGEYIKYDINNGVYQGGKKILKPLDKNLLKLKDDLDNFNVVFPKILGEMFGKEIGEKLKDQLSGFGKEITIEKEDEILGYYLRLNITKVNEN